MIKVAICITTYNLEKYIAQALDSVLSQKTNFDYKIIIADDCSSDNTINILSDYQTCYPEIIELMTTPVNLGSLANSNRIFDGLQSQYFTFLDGDDYWIKDTMLQEQVDFLDSHPKYSICGANTYYLKNDKLDGYVIPKDKTGKTYSFDDYLNYKMPFVHTSSILVRNTIFINGLPKCYKEVVGTFEDCALRGEDFRRIIHLEQGAAYIMDDFFSVYRIHDKGIWQGSSVGKRLIEGAIGENFYKKFFGNKYGNVFVQRSQKTYQSLIRTLLIDFSLLADYHLTNKESFLLTAYLNDISKNNHIYTVKTKSLNKRRMILLLMKIIQYLCK
ncbi:MAG: glycosyltransferase family 2 protein [Mediterranea massiliensis]|nr:glycosyltransferase family 2 protein [Mediterranea massiliensis]